MNMKRTIMSALCALLVANVSLADKITVDEAQAVASRFFGGSSTMRKAKAGDGALTLAASSKGYYAFNRGTSSGFVIVAADDNAVAQVLGYADEGTLDMASIPANMAWWLSEYDRQMELASKSTATGVKAAPAVYATIEPLVAAKWDQESPYNALCPTLNGETCATGCLATAMAQIMYYHKWPLVGTGSHSYTCNGQTLSVDFSQSTYDWNSMTATYGSSSSEESKAAVAKLMYDAGVSVDMIYSSSGSGSSITYVPSALINYFSYDKNIKTLQRVYYGLSEWNAVVYGELAAARPVLYCGANSNADVGHAFVCDGYKDGYFHINWGWSGLSDGYFLLSALDPDQQGTGGSNAGYDDSQEISVNVQRAQDNGVIEPLYYNDNNFNVSQKSVSFSHKVSFTGSFRNRGVYASAVNLGIMVIGAAGDTTCLSGRDGTYQANSGTNAVSVNLSQFPSAAGTYTVYPAYMDKNTQRWYKMQTDRSYTGSLTAKVNGTSIVFSTPEERASELSCTDFAASSSLYAGKAFSATATISNAGAEYDGVVYVKFTKPGAIGTAGIVEGAKVDLDEGMSQTINISGTCPETAGDYEMQLVDNTYEAIGEKVSVTVSEAPTGDVALSLTNQLHITRPKAVTADNISVLANIRCTSGFYSDYLALAFFKNGATYTQTMITVPLIAGEGENVSVTFKGMLADAEVGDTYQACIYYRAEDGGSTSWAMLPALNTNYNYLSFTIGHLTGIDAVSSASSADEVLIYTLSGTLVARQNGAAADLSALPKGLYVVKKGAETMKVRN